MTRYEEEQEMQDLVGIRIKNLISQTIYEVTKSYHNIYGDICLEVTSSKGEKFEIDRISDKNCTLQKLKG